MKLLRLLSLLTIVVLVAMPFTALAQGQTPTPKTKDFATKDGTLTVTYPDTWFAQENDQSATLFGVTFGNSEDVLKKAFADTNSDFATGDQAVVVFLMPTDFLAMAGVTIAPNATVTDITQSLVDALFAREQTAAGTPTPESPNVGKVEEIDLTKDIKAGYVTVTDPTVDGAVVAYPLTDGIIAVTFIFAYPKEYNDDLATIGKQIAASIKYTGTAQDLMNKLTGAEGTGTPVATPEGGTPSGTPSAALDGKALVDERCTNCHSRSRIDQKMASGADLAAWTQTVDRMISYGAQLDDQERQAVLDYLTSGK